MTLDPSFHFLEVAYPYVAHRLLTDEDPALRERLIQVLFQVSDESALKDVTLHPGWKISMETIGESYLLSQRRIRKCIVRFK